MELNYHALVIESHPVALALLARELDSCLNSTNKIYAIWTPSDFNKNTYEYIKPKLKIKEFHLIGNKLVIQIIENPSSYFISYLKSVKDYKYCEILCTFNLSLFGRHLGTITNRTIISDYIRLNRTLLLETEAKDPVRYAFENLDSILCGP